MESPVEFWRLNLTMLREDPDVKYTATCITNNVRTFIFKDVEYVSLLMVFLVPPEPAIQSFKTLSWEKLDVKTMDLILQVQSVQFVTMKLKP